MRVSCDGRACSGGRQEWMQSDKGCDGQNYSEGENEESGISMLLAVVHEVSVEMLRRLPGRLGERSAGLFLRSINGASDGSLQTGKCRNRASTSCQPFGRPVRS